MSEWQCENNGESILYRTSIVKLVMSEHKDFIAELRTEVLLEEAIPVHA